MSLVTSILAWAAALWIVVAVIAVANGGRLSPTTAFEARSVNEAVTGAEVDRTIRKTS